MKKLSVFLCIVLLFTSLCPLGMAEGLGTSTDICQHVWIWQSNETECWQLCAECGQVSSRFDHRAACTAPTVCTRCGYVGAIARVEHAETTWWYNETECWPICSACGERLQHHKDPYHAAWCTAPNICGWCGYQGTIAQISHRSTHTEYNETECWRVCNDCGQEAAGSRDAHYSTCSQPNVCLKCGYVGDMDVVMHDGELIEEYNDTECWVKCTACNYESEHREHEAVCFGPGNVCWNCGYVGNIKNIYHEFVHRKYDENECWDFCTACNQELEGTRYEHVANCTAPTQCVNCIYQGNNIPVDHVGEWIWDHDDTSCWAYCADCNAEVYRGEHYAYCYAPNVCAQCSAPYHGSNVSCPYPENESSHNPETHAITCEYCGKVQYILSLVEEIQAPTCTQHGQKKMECSFCGETVIVSDPATGHDWQVTGQDSSAIHYTCSKCGETKDEVIPPCEHDWQISGQDGNTVHYTCSKCGETKDEVIPPCQHDWQIASQEDATCESAGSRTMRCTLCGEMDYQELPALGHEWQRTDRVAPTCERNGYEDMTCNRCNSTYTQTLPATGHHFGTVYQRQNDGTHAVFCATCNAKRALPCNFIYTTMDQWEYGCCSVCGYTVYRVANTVNQPENTEIAVQTTIVENAAFAYVDQPTAKANDVQLLVYEAELETEEALSVEVPSNVKKLLLITLVQDGQTLQPAGRFEVRIPVSQENATPLKLVQLNENGEWVEVPYEILDGMIVFETDVTGMFFFLNEAPSFLAA